MIHVSTREVFEYTLERDRETDKPSIFRLKPLTPLEVKRIGDLMGNRNSEYGFPVGSFVYENLKCGLVGWDNVEDKAGKPVKFAKEKDGRVKDAIIAMLGSDDQSELAFAIWGAAKLTEEDEKNS